MLLIDRYSRWQRHACAGKLRKQTDVLFFPLLDRHTKASSCTTHIKSSNRVCVCGCVLHIQALETHTAIQDYARAHVQAACTVSRRQAAPRPQTVSHTSMLRRQEQLTKYPTTNKTHQKPWEFSGTEWMSQIESGEGVREERWKRISKNENLSIPYWPFWPLHSHHSLQMKVSFQVRPKC